MSETATGLRPLPPEDAALRIFNGAYPVLVRTHESAEGFLARYAALRAGNDKRDILAEDILRSLLLQVVSGCEALFKILLRQSLANTLDGSRPDIFIPFRAWAVSTLTTEPEYLANVLCSGQPPHRALTEDYLTELTGRSLQSVGGMKQVLAALGLEQEDFLKSARRIRLERLFEARRQILHNFDLDVSAGRKERTREETLELVNEALAFTHDVLARAGADMVKYHEDSLIHHGARAPAQLPPRRPSRVPTRGLDAMAPKKGKK